MTTYKCHHCHYSTRSFVAMAAHSRKKHPGIMKKRAKKAKSGGYCTKCGRKL